MYKRQLFEYALTETFDRRRGPTLTRADYRAVGGMRGALARRAEQTFGTLEPDERAATRQVFLRLVTLERRGMSGGMQMQRIRSAGDLARLRGELQAQRDPDKPCVAICAGTGCQAYGVNRVIEAFAQELAKRGPADGVDILATGCPGFCERGPLVTIRPEGIFYQRVQMKDVPEIVEQTLVKGLGVARLLYHDPWTG